MEIWLLLVNKYYCYYYIRDHPKLLLKMYANGGVGECGKRGRGMGCPWRSLEALVSSSVVPNVRQWNMLLRVVWEYDSLIRFVLAGHGRPYARTKRRSFWALFSENLVKMISHQLNFKSNPYNNICTKHNKIYFRSVVITLLFQNMQMKILIFIFTGPNLINYSNSRN